MTCIDHPALLTIDRRRDRIPAHLTLPSVLTIDILSRKFLSAPLAIKSLTKVHRHDVAVHGIYSHPLCAPIPQTPRRVVRVLLLVPFTDVSTDAGPGTSNPHPAWVAGHFPLAFVDADHVIARVGSEGEIVFVDP